MNVKKSLIVHKEPEYRAVAVAAAIAVCARVVYVGRVERRVVAQSRDRVDEVLVTEIEYREIVFVLLNIVEPYTRRKAGYTVKPDESIAVIVVKGTVSVEIRSDVFRDLKIFRQSPFPVADRLIGRRFQSSRYSVP